MTQKTLPLTAPSAIRRWRFGQLSAAELLPYLQQKLLATDPEANWQLVWLNNDGRAVIGLLPKVSWAVYANVADATDTARYQVIKTCRDTRSSNSQMMSYAHWQEELITYSAYHHAIDKNNIRQYQNDKPIYQHGLIGFIGYDIASQALSPDADIKCATQPTAVLGHYDIYLTPLEHEQGWTLHLPLQERISAQGLSDIDAKNNNDQHTAIQTVIKCLDSLDDELSAINSVNKDQNSLAPLILSAKWQKNNYQQAFSQTQHYLVQGDCYQINLTQAWQGCLTHSKNNHNVLTKLIDYLPTLHQNTHAPFAGYLGFNPIHNAGVKGNDFELLSCSPELFFTFIKDNNTGTHHIRTKPIKGTRPRSRHPKQDLLLKQQLTDSTKDRAENVMIVDLLRNDLGRYAKTGSVKVPQLFSIESFSNVHHMVSTITAELQSDVHPLAVLFGSLPAGSITGTPKKRAVEIIAELEGTARGAYCGTMGYMNFDGSGQWNVLIRTLQANNSSNGEKQVNLWAGGGITIASDCDEEYQECLDKVGNLLAVLAQSDD